MSFFGDLFGGADNAAQAQTDALNLGLGQSQDLFTQGNKALSTNYGKALTPFLTNQNTAATGVNALGNALGINGAQGTQNALAQLQTTPGYQFALGQGNNAINAAAAANGTLGSGNQLMALSKFNEGLAGQNYNNYVSQLQPYLGFAGQSAAGLGGVYTGLGSGLNQNTTNLANLTMGAETGIGNAQASADLANQSMDMSLLGGGLKLAGSLAPFLL